MFGVNEKGEDILAPQFSRGGRRNASTLKPGSSLDLQMAADSNYRSSLRDPEVMASAKLNVLSVMLDHGEIELAEQELQAARNALIEGVTNAWDARHERLKEDQRVLTSAHSAQIDAKNVLSQDRLDRAYQKYERDKALKQYKENYSKNPPEVIRLALKMTMEAGQFDHLGLQARVDSYLRERALDQAKRFAEEQQVAASRAAILSLGI